MEGSEVLRRGVLLDAQGRCAHYHGERDVVLNRCGTCGDYFACHRCHAELCGHPFGRLALSDPAAVLCGACGATMSRGEIGYAEADAGASVCDDAPAFPSVADPTSRAPIAVAPACPSCGHGFNPGCAEHAYLYWDAEPQL